MFNSGPLVLLAPASGGPSWSLRLVIAVFWLTLAAPAADAAQAPVLTKGPVDVSAVGPQVGQQIPEFRLTDQAGQVWTRESIAGPKGAMLVFFRSADW